MSSGFTPQRLSLAFLCLAAGSHLHAQFLTSISITGPGNSMPANTTAQFSAAGIYSDGSTRNITTQVFWNSSNTSAATIGTSTGLVTGVGLGATNIRASLGNVISTIFPLSVTGASSLISIFVTTPNSSIVTGSTTQFSATANYSDGTFSDLTGLATWTSSNTAIATIGVNNGFATALASGSTNINATYGGVTSNSFPLSVTGVIQALPPTIVSANPAGGSGSAQSFTYTISSPTGAQTINLVDVLINNFLDGRNACYVAVVPSGAGSATVYLVNDAGASGGPFASMTIPGSGTIQNSQCIVSAAASSILASGTNLTVTLGVFFQGTFRGNKIFYVSAANDVGNSGWQAAGTWNVPGGPTSALSAVSTSPVHSTSAAGTYTFTFADTAGFGDLTVLNVLINDFIDGRNACYVAYVPSGPNTGTLYLVDDAGDSGGPFVSMTIPSSSIVQNSHCVISGSGSSVFANGNTLSLTLNYTFTNFTGNRVMYLAARNSTSSSDWQAAGSISLP